MGSGRFPEEGYAKAAYINDLWTLTVDSGSWQLNQNVNATRNSVVTNDTCYNKTNFVSRSGFPWNEFYYGGAGKTAASCNFCPRRSRLLSD
jgi:hypothetical protein